MPKLIIDDIPVEVPAGTSVLEAAKSVGIWIPHFCYHPALGSVGACRVCAVKLLDGPVKGLQMSCMLPAQDGMVVSTTDEEAQAMRRHVIEWLMINHPHDCPVCDEGGECLLQDYTIAGGHGIRRYQGKKRTHLNQDLGPQIQHEMNRCIQCYRCARFYQEYAGGTDFGVSGSAARVYFGRFADGKLESPFSGNLVDICPTGVFTDRTARFRARYWDYDMAPSICNGCSVGCATTPAARYRELLKVIARRNDRVNGWFICDRGRFDNAPVNATDRPRTPLSDGAPTDRETVLDALVGRIGEMLELHGPEGLALVGSPRLSLEGNLLLARLAELLGGAQLCYFVKQEERERSAAAVALLADRQPASQEDVRHADCVAILDCDLREEGPMMLLAARQAWRAGAPVFLVGHHAPLTQVQEISMEAVQLDYLEEVPLAIFDRPVVICGTQRNSVDTIKTLVHAEAQIACLQTGPDGCGAALLSGDHGAISLEEAVANGAVQGIIAVEADIPVALLAQVEVVAALDWQPTDTVQRAQLFLPTTAWVEMDGTYVNYEGRAQRFRRVMQAGLPIKGLDLDLHPPRIHRGVPPGSDPRPSWELLAAFAERLGGDTVTEPLSDDWEKLRALDPEGDGVRVYD